MIEPEDERKVRSMVAESGKKVEFFRAELDEKQFKLNIIPLPPEQENA